MENNLQHNLYCDIPPIETEVKILEINAERLENMLQARWAIQKFSGRVYDVFFDFWKKNEFGEPQKILDSVGIGLRIRKKINAITGEVKYNYTLKKDIDTEIWVKSCIEYEGKLDEEGVFYEFLKQLQEMISQEKLMPVIDKQKFSKIFHAISFPENIFGLEKFEWFFEEFLQMERVQIRDKKRISYSLWDENFDIDTYEGIPTFLEIEAENRTRIDMLLKEFWLENHILLPYGYTGLMSYYGKTI